MAPPALHFRATGLRPSSLFDVPNRRHVYESVAISPGIGFRQLVRASGLGAGTVRHHLNVLIRHGILDERRAGSRIAFFHAGATTPAWRGVVALRDPSLRELHAFALTTPGSCQRFFIDAMARRGWPRTTTVHRLARLERHGLLQSILGRRARRYWPVPNGIEPAAHPALFHTPHKAESPVIGQTSASSSFGELNP
jgi:DNA-binding transcriptional ArsR family regulator